MVSSDRTHQDIIANSWGERTEDDTKPGIPDGFLFSHCRSRKSKGTRGQGDDHRRRFSLLLLQRFSRSRRASNRRGCASPSTRKLQPNLCNRSPSRNRRALRAGKKTREMEKSRSERRFAWRIGGKSFTMRGCG